MLFQVKRSTVPLALLFLAAAAVSAFHVWSFAIGYPFYRDIHMGTAILYARDGIDLLRPVIVGFNANQAPTPQEFPFWQAGAAIALRVLHGSWIGPVLLSLVSMFSILYPLYRLAKKTLGSQATLWSLPVFLLQPLTAQYAGTASTDGLALAASVWFFYAAYRLLERPIWPRWILTTLAACLAATLKLPFFFCSGLAGAILLWAHYRRSWKAWIALSSAGALSLIVFLAWTSWTNHCYSLALFPEIELRMSENTDIVRWYFGDWAYRLNPANWIKAGWRFPNCLLGSFALAALPAVAFFAVRRNAAHFWFLGAIATTLVFSKLVLIHSHYYLMYAPSMAMLTGAGIASLLERLALKIRPAQTLVPILISIALFAATVQGLIGIEVVLNYDPHPKRVAEMIRRYTTPDDKLLMVEGSWGGNELILSDRNGLSTHPNYYTVPRAPDLGKAYFESLRELKYTKMVIVRHSDLLVALQKINPGNADYSAKPVQDAVPYPARDWPTLLETENVIIKEIPSWP